MSDSRGDGKASRSSPADQPINPHAQATPSPDEGIPSSMNPTSDQSAAPGSPSPSLDPEADSPVQAIAALMMVETAFLASTASLIWLINYYFPMGPFLRIFFPTPIALVYLRWGNRAAWMSALVSGLLLSVLMGPTRSILFVMPYGLLGVLLGTLWRRRANWLISISVGTLIGTLGFFFRIWLLSVLVGDDLWIYFTTQITELAEWAFVKLGLLLQPDLSLIQALALVMVLLNNLIYLFVVHVAAWLLLERLGNSIPAPPNWVQVLLDYDTD